MSGLQPRPTLGPAQGPAARGQAPLTHGSGHLSPLQHHILNDPPVRVDVDTLVLVAQQHLHAIGVGEEDDGVGCDLALDLGGGGLESLSLEPRLAAPSAHSPAELT